MKYLLGLLGLIYTLCPYDLFPDLIIGWGWIDDIAVLGLLWWYFYKYKKKRSGYERYFRKGDQHFEGTREGGPFKGDTTGSTPKDPYSVLEISGKASQEDIKQAFRRLANKYHPDKVSHMGDEFKELAERRFKEIQEAYQKLKV